MSQSSIPPSNESFSFRAMNSNATGLLVVPCDDEEQLNSIPGWCEFNTDHKDPLKDVNPQPTAMNADCHSEAIQVQAKIVSDSSSDKFIHEVSSFKGATLYRSKSESNLNLSETSFSKIKSSSLEDITNSSFSKINAQICDNKSLKSLSNTEIIDNNIGHSAIEKFVGLLRKSKDDIQKIRISMEKEKLLVDKSGKAFREEEISPINPNKRCIDKSDDRADVTYSKPKFFKLSNVSDEVKNMYSPVQGSSHINFQGITGISNAISKLDHVVSDNICARSEILPSNHENNFSPAVSHLVLNPQINGTVSSDLRSISSAAADDVANSTLVPSKVPAVGNDDSKLVSQSVSVFKEPDSSSVMDNICHFTNKCQSFVDNHVPIIPHMGPFPVRSNVLVTQSFHTDQQTSLTASTGSVSSRTSGPISSVAERIVSAVTPSINAGSEHNNLHFRSSVCNVPIVETNQKPDISISYSQIAKHLNTSIVSSKIPSDANGKNNEPKSDGTNSVVPDIPNVLGFVALPSSTGVKVGQLSNADPQIHSMISSSPRGDIQGNASQLNNFSSNTDDDQRMDIDGIRTSDAPSIVPSVNLDIPELVVSPSKNCLSSTPVRAQTSPNKSSYVQVAKNLDTYNSKNTPAIKDMNLIYLHTTDVEDRVQESKTSTLQPFGETLQNSVLLSSTFAVPVPGSKAGENNLDETNYRVGDDTQKACLGIADNEFMSTGSFRSNDGTICQKDHPSTYILDHPTNLPQEHSDSPIPSGELFPSQQRDGSNQKEPSETVQPSCLRKVSSAHKKLSFADELDQVVNVHNRSEMLQKRCSGKRKRSDVSEEATCSINADGEISSVFHFDLKLIKAMADFISGEYR